MLTTIINIILLLGSVLVPLSRIKAKRKKPVGVDHKITQAYSDYAVNEKGELEFFKHESDI